jgi:hypothetical protein
LALSLREKVCNRYEYGTTEYDDYDQYFDLAVTKELLVFHLEKIMYPQLNASLWSCRFDEQEKASRPTLGTSESRSECFRRACRRILNLPKVNKEAITFPQFPGL